MKKDVRYEEIKRLHAQGAELLIEDIDYLIKKIDESTPPTGEVTVVKIKNKRVTVLDYKNYRYNLDQNSIKH